MKKKSEEENQKDNTGWNAFLELRRQAQRGMLRTMQQLSADAEKVGSAEMTLDEINAEIAAARSGMEPVAICDHMEAKNIHYERKY